MNIKSLRLKRALRTALLVLLLNAVGMGKGYAQEVVVIGDLKYSLSDSTAKVIGPKYTNPTGPLAIPSSVTRNGNVYSVTEIGNRAFEGCSGFTGSLTIPNSVTSIGVEAFSGCSGFTGNLTIPNSVSWIESWAFRGCSGLNNISTENSETYIYNDAFYNTGWYNEQPDGILYLDSWCLGYKGDRPTGSLNIRENTKVIAAWAFSGCSGLTGNLTIPNSVIIICEQAFRYCGFTGKLTIPNSVTRIDEQAFLFCSGFIDSLIIPNSVTRIGGGAFRGCSGFTGSLTIPNSVTEIGNWAFDYCTGITGTLTIGNSVTKIGLNPFSGCSGLEQIVVDPSNRSYYSYNNAIYNWGDNPYYYRTTLVTGCKNTIISPADIGDYAFEGCIGLTDLTIPSSVENIGIWAFKGCSGLTSITSLAMTPPSLGGRAFEGVSCDTVTVRCDCIAAYEASSAWTEYFNTFVEDCDSHSISIDNTSGGAVSSSVSLANLGEEIRLTIEPNEGMTLSSLTVSNAHNPLQVVPFNSSWGSSYFFTMPQFDVIVKAVFTNGSTVGEGNSIVASVYPNPTTGMVSIEAEGIKRISINNTLGQTIYKGKISGNEFEYDFGQHGEGVYLIRIATTNGVTTKRVVVTR